MNATLDTMPLVVSPQERGTHGDTAERYRQLALSHLNRLAFCVSMLDYALRMTPGDNAAMAEWGRVGSIAEAEYNVAVVRYWQCVGVAGEA